MIKAIEEAKTVFITAHVGPDGDTLGSMLALKFALEKARDHIHTVDCVISGKMPDVYGFMPGIREVHRMEAPDGLLEKDQYDLAISVDCGSLDRLGPAAAYFQGAKTSVNIDHHISNEQFGTLNVVDTAAAASGEVVYDLLQTMNVPLDANIATCLYTAIVTDTGGFKYSNTTAKVMEVSAKLVAAGANPEYIFKQLYEEKPLAQLRLQADAFIRSKLNETETICWTVVTRDLLATHGALEEHVDGVVETLRRIDTVLIAMVLKETEEGHTRVSMRSDTHDIDVAKIMTDFGGGGHKMAAGCTIEKPPAEAEKMLLPILEEQVRQRQLVR